VALPLRIFALSSPHSGTVFIHATLGGCGDERSGQPKKSAVDAHLSCTQRGSTGLEKLPPW
jgi:hypothetical protein